MWKVARRAVVKRQNFQGLDLAIEFVKGGKRPFTDDAGKEHFKTMYADYGEVRGTEGLDGDAVDVYVGPDKSSDRAFVVTQMKKGDWKKVDEEKCILGVHSIDEAKRLYLKHYDDPRFCGSIKEMSMTKFKERLATKGAVGEKIASTTQRIANLNYLRLQEGDEVLVGERHGVKVGADWGARLAALQARRDPNGIEGPIRDPSRAEVDAFLSEYGKLAGKESELDPDPQWDVDMPDDVKKKLRKEAPVSYEDKRRAAVAESDVVKYEQIGIGIPENRVAKNPKDSKMRKAAALASVNCFLKEASSSAKKDNRAGQMKSAAERKHLRDRALVLGGGAAGAVGAHEAAKRYGHKVLGYAPDKAQLATALVMGGVGGAQLTRAALRDHYKSAAAEKKERIMPAATTVGATLGGLAGVGHTIHQMKKGKRPRFDETAVKYLGGSAAGAAAGLTASVAAKVIKAHKNRAPKLSRTEKEQKTERRVKRLKGLMGGAAGAAAGAAIAHHGLKRFGANMLAGGNKERALKKLDKQIAHHARKSKSNFLPGFAENRIRMGKLMEERKDTERIPKKFFAGVSDEALQTARRAGGAAGFVGGAYAAGRSREKKAGMSDRAHTISDRLDDVGIATLASPYVAGGLAKRLKHRRGLPGLVGRGLEAYHDNFPAKNRKEIAGLALVAPGITHTLAKGIDKGVAKAKGRTKKALMINASYPQIRGEVLKMPEFIGPIHRPSAPSVPQQTLRMPSQLAAATTPAATNVAQTATTATTAATKPGVLKRGLKAMGRTGGGALALGALGVGVGMYGAKKLLTGHRHEGISSPSYQPPRLF